MKTMRNTSPRRILFGFPAFLASPRQLIPIAFAISLAYGSPIDAQDTASSILDVVEIDVLLELMETEGYSVHKDADGDILWEIDGYKTWIISMNYGETLLFYTGFSDAVVSLKRVNEWNSTTLYARSYLDEDDDPMLEHSIKITGGVARERLIDFLKVSKALFATWHREVVR